MNDLLLTGFAEVDFTPAPGLALRGQMHERIAQSARDPLLANAVALRQGDLTVVLVSVDVCLLAAEFVDAVQREFERCIGIPGHCLLPHSTHTHVAPCTVQLNGNEADSGFLASLKAAILCAAKTAVVNLGPLAIHSGTGCMEQMGWNRRAMFADGASRMYGHSDMAGFIGMEGPRDSALPVLFARDGAGAVRGAIVNFSTHPNAIENETVYSADIPGALRKTLKDALGPELVVVYLTGAAGNTAPRLLDPHDEAQPWCGEAGLRRSGLYMGGEAIKTITAAVAPIARPQLRLLQTTLDIPLRAWPGRDESSYPIPLIDRRAWPDAAGYYERTEKAWPQRQTRQPTVPVRLSVLRIGDTAICTNPCELFVEFGLAIRAASPARVTAIGELTDGYAGYVPTALAFSRGGYETWCAPGSQLAPDAGDRIVAATRELLQSAFPDSCSPP